MQLIIKGKQMQVTPQLRQRIERKVQRLSRFVDEESRVEVTVVEEQTRSARDRFSVRLVLSGNTSPIHSEVSALNASTALDLVLDKIVSQLGRHKDKLTRERRQHTPVKILSLARSGHISPLEDEQEEEESFAGEDEVKDNEAIWSRVLEIRQLPTQPMTDQEVIEHMEETGATFYPFFNQETRSVNVMYKLDAGGYGLLVPVLE